VYADGTAEGWQLEHDEITMTAVDATPTPEGHELAFRFGLAQNTPVPPWAALVHPIALPVETRAVRFEGRANRPMRVSVELRAPAIPEPSRWRRSVYLDTAPRRVVVPFEDMRRAARLDGPLPDPSTVDALLFVVETTNTRPGSSGIVWLDDIAFVAGGPPAPRAASPPLP